MRAINMHEAKSTLSQLVRRAERGEEIIIARNGVPVARIVPLTGDGGRRMLGLRADAPFDEAMVAESLRPLSAEELSAWYGPVEPGTPDR
jgi:prevent-host-death family protein